MRKWERGKIQKRKKLEENGGNKTREEEREFRHRDKENGIAKKKENKRRKERN